MKIPDAALHQNIAVLGKNGSGKTYAAKAVIVEPLLAGGRRVGIVDPTGAWWGLRTSRDGKGAGFKILVLGGDHADLPLPPNSGAAVARLLAVQGVNLVADTSQMTVGERTRWFTEFAGTLYRANKTPLHLILDEAHNFAPQGKVPDPDAGKMLHAASTLASQGRSRGIRLTMITQRPQKLHKDSLTSAETLIAMRVIHPLDRGAVADWINGCADPAKGKEVLDSLAGLKTGEGWVWHPGENFLHQMKFPAIKTFDSSATPMDGEAVANPKGAAEIDLIEIRAAMADAVKEAEANDPKLLRARIAQLEREAKRPAPSVAVPEPDPKLIEEAEKRGYSHGRTAGIAEAVSAVQELAFKDAAIPAWQPPKPRAPAARQQRTPAPRAAPAQPAEGVSRSQQRILDALAYLESIGIAQPSKDQLALWAEVSPTSGGYFNNLGALRSMGLIDYPAGGTVALTDAGGGVAVVSSTPTTEEMQEALCARVGNAKAAILRALIEIYPKDIAKDELAERISVSPTSGGYFNNLGSLRTLGVIDYPSPGRVAALPVMFID